MADTGLLDVKIGRPVEYTPERIRAIADGLLEYMQQKGNYFLDGYAHTLGISRQRFSELAEKDTYFADAYHRAKEMQAVKLATDGLQSKTNAQMTKFTLMNVAGWRESGQMDVTSNGQALGYVALPQAKAVADAEVIELED